MELAIEPGAEATVALTVADADTAVALGSGDVAVLATPRIIALAEQAAVAAVSGHLPEHLTTVGAHVELDHLAPTRVGGTVQASALLEAVEGRSLTFSITVTEGTTEVARGRHRRSAVDRAQF